MKKTLLICLVLLVTLMSVGCAAEQNDIFFSDAQLEAVGNTAENACDILKLEDENLVLDTPVGYYGQNGPGVENDSPSDIVRAYEKAFEFCGEKLAAYSVINFETDSMIFYGVHDTVADASYIETALTALCGQFGTPSSYTVDDTGYACGETEPDYEALLADFENGEGYLQFQWVNPCDNIGRIQYRITQQTDGIEFYVYVYVADSFVN